LKYSVGPKNSAILELTPKWGHDRIFPKEHAKGGVNKPVAIQFNLATELRNKKSLFLQSEAKPLRKRSFVQHAEPAAVFA
jgi:hypothetical protein